MISYKQRLGVIVLFGADIAILYLIAAIAIAIRSFIPDICPAYPAFSMHLQYFLLLFPIWGVIMSYEGAYTRKFTFWDEVWLLWKASLFSTLAIFAVIFLGNMGNAVSRTVVMLIGILSLVIFPILRMAVKRCLFRSALLKSRVLILGANGTGSLALSALRREPNLGYEVVGFVDDRLRSDTRHIDGVKVHRYLDRTERYIRHCDIQEVVIALPDLDKKKLSNMINRLQHKAKNILYIPDFTGMAVLGTKLRHFFHDQMFALEIKNNLAQPFNHLTKKVFDYFMGAVLFLVLLLPMAIIALLIRATSPGPAIFRQERIGKDLKSFHCYKFRTMYQDAEERLQHILDADAEAKAVWEHHWKLRDDPRITPLGNFLRKSSLDELPQILNVLLGDMSLVGPRPVTQEEIDRYYKDSAEFCFSVLPGITGLWQVSGRSNTSYNYRVSLDSWYVSNWNLWLDIVILLKTIKAVLNKEGAE